MEDVEDEGTVESAGDVPEDAVKDAVEDDVDDDVEDDVEDIVEDKNAVENNTEDDVEGCWQRRINSGRMEKRKEEQCQGSII